MRQSDRVASDGFVKASSITVHQLADYEHLAGNDCSDFSIYGVIYLADCLELSCNHCLIVKMEDVAIRFGPRFQLICGYRAYRVIWMSTKLEHRAANRCWQMQ